MTKYFALTLAAVIALSCQKKNEDSREMTECLFANPEALFGEDLGGVNSHHFVFDGVKSKEELSFNDGVSLVVVQSGCEHIKQEFRFSIPDKPLSRDPDRWISMAAAQFRRIASFGPEYLVFQEWAEAISQRVDELSTGQTAELQPGFFVKIEPENNQKDAIFRVTLSDH